MNSTLDTQKKSILTNDPHTRMLCQHIGTHLICLTFFDSELLLIVNPIPNDVLVSDVLFRLWMMDRVMDEVDGRLAVYENFDRTRYSNRTLHFEL